MRVTGTSTLSGRCVSLICLLGTGTGAGLMAQEDTQQRDVRYNDITTWPKAPEGCVQFFALESRQERLGVSLAGRVHHYDEVIWRWAGNGFSGDIRVSTWPSARGAHRKVASVLGLWQLPASEKKPWMPAGRMLGDISWFLGQYVVLARRNVALRVGIRGEGPAATDQLVRLCRAVVREIDSAELVTSADAVRCPMIEISVPEKMALTQVGSVTVVAHPRAGATLRHVCRARPAEGVQVTGPEPNATGELRYTLVPKEAGTVEIIAGAADQHGMAREVRKTIAILENPPQ